MKRVVLLLLIVLYFSGLQAQKKKDKHKEYFLDAEYFFAQEEYVDALIDYVYLYNNGFDENANINYRIGICYLKISGLKEKAVKHLEKATLNTKKNNIESKFKETRAPLDAWLYLGIAYRINYLLDDAIEAFQKYKDILPSKNLDAHEYIDREIQSCHKAKEFIQDPVRVKLVNLGEKINSSSSNYKAVLSGDGKTMFYMNELPFYNAVYYARFVNGKWTTPANITPQIQSDGNQYVSSVSFDGKTLYLTKEDHFNSDIFVSYLKDSVWGKSEPVKGGINTRFWESHASISNDGKTLYFASNQPKGYGAMDLYKSELVADGIWGPPQNLGPAVNTPANEDTPFITEDGKTLYFSSQGHNGMGGYDLYKSEMGADGKWKQPENLGYPLSTTDDDLFYYPWRNGEHALFATFEIDGFGKEDIYEIQYLHGSLFKVTESEEIFADKIITEEKKIIDDIVTPASEDSGLLITDVTDEKEAVVQKLVITEISKKEIVLSPLYYEFNSSLINTNGKDVLDQIADLLKKYDDIFVELIGHTDAIGPAEYNQKLSEKRALAALNYLTGKGVPVKKIKTRGLGESSFAAINSNADGSDNVEGRKLNRRVEFEFSGNDSDKVQVSYPEIPERLKIR
jgi:outer membrane protein OmpA-like peptidoglycan-associated protein/YHS domain-containing protein